MNPKLLYAERVYSHLLALYPARFRARFAQEMLQLFRDTCHDALLKGEAAVFTALLVRTVGDLLMSAAAERRRSWIDAGRSQPLLAGIVDLLLIPTMVAGNLLVLGPVLTMLLRNGASLTAQEFVVTSGVFSCGFGALAIAGSIAFARIRPTVRLWVKLSA